MRAQALAPVRPGSSAGAVESPGTGRGDVLLALVLIGLSGNMALIDGERRWLALSLMAGVCLALLVWRRGSKLLTTRFLAVGGVFAAIGTVHLLYLRGAEPLPVIGFLVRLFCAYAVVRLTRGFARSYTRAMVLVAGLGLSIFLVDQLLLAAGADLRVLLEPIQSLIGVEDDFNVLVHNFQTAVEYDRFAIRALDVFDIGEVPGTPAFQRRSIQASDRDHQGFRWARNI